MTVKTAKKRVEGAKGGQAQPRQPTEAPDSLHSTAKARIMLALGEGEFAGPLTEQNIFLDGSPLAGPNGNRNFDGVSWDWRPGSVQQDPIPGVGEVASETSVGVELKQTQPWQHRISNTQLDAFRIRIGFPRMVQIKTNGDSVGARVDYRILLSVDDGPYQVYGDFVADGKTTSLYERGHLVMLPAANSHWDVRVERTTPDSTSDALANSTNIEAYSDIIFAKFRYPNTATLFVQFNARTFGNSIPKITVRVKMRRILIPRNYDPITRTYTGTWDGQFKFDWTDNPAWIWLDVVTNKRFGAGEHITVDNVNKWELYRIAQYCDQLVPDGSGGTEPRHTCNVYIQSQAAAFTVLRDLANIYNGMVGYQNSEIIARADMPDDVVKVVSNANVVGGKFDYSGGSVKDRYTVCLVQYSNPANGYTDDTDAVRELDLVRRYGVNTLNITAIGCTRRSEAQRRGRWALLSNSTDRLVRYNTGLEGLSYHAGQVIAVSDAFTSGHRLGGRVVSAAGSSVVLDALPTGMGIGAKLFVNTGGGVAEGRTIVSIDTATNTVLIDQAFNVLPQPEEVWTIDAASFDGAQAISLQLFRVMSILNNEDGTFSVEGLWYNAAKYSAIDSGVRIPEPNYSDIPGGVIAAPAYVNITSYTKFVQAMSVQTLRVEWPKVEGAISYRAQWKRDSGEWINVPESAALGFEVDSIYAGTYQARVCAINAVGATSLWQNAEATRLSGKDGEVPPLPALVTAPLPWGIKVDWFYAPGSEDGNYVELQYSINGQDAWQNLSNISYPGTSYSHLGLRAGAIFFYRARLIDKLGNQSAWTSPVKGESSTDADLILDLIKDDFMTAADGKLLTDQLNGNFEALMQQALTDGYIVDSQFKVNGAVKAGIAQMQKVQADTDRAFAEFQTVVSAQIGEQGAILEQKMTSVFDATTGGSAMYSLKAGVNYDGSYYDAGMVLGVTAGPNGVVSRIGFNADQLVLLSGQGDLTYSPFAVINGQVFINQAFIQDGTITSAKIKDASITSAKISNTIESDDWGPSGGATGWQISKSAGITQKGNTPGQGATITDVTGVAVYDGGGVQRVKLGRLF